MDWMQTIFITQILMITSFLTQIITSDVFHHYGSFPGYYKKYKMSLTTTPTTLRPEKQIVYPFGEFYPVDGSEYFIN